MNMFYGLSVMAQRGNVSASDYSDDMIADPGILALIPRIKVAVDPEIDGMGPVFRHAARVAVRTTDGTRRSRDVWHRRGSPENPVSRSEVEEKFSANVDGLLGTDAAQRLQSFAARLEALPDAADIVAILAAPVSS
jgi:2-methylcitrate dehydratase PrpD